MGEFWASGSHAASAPLDPWGTRGLTTMSLASELLHYLWTLLGVHVPVIYGSPSGAAGALLSILGTRS